MRRRLIVAAGGSSLAAFCAGAGHGSLAGLVIVLLLSAAVSALIAYMLPMVGWWSVAAGVVVGFGAGIQLAWTDSPFRGAIVPLLAAAAGILVGSGLVYYGLRSSDRARVRLAQILLWGALVARVAASAVGDAQTGRLGPVLTGEIGRALAVIGVGLMLAGISDVQRSRDFGNVRFRDAFWWVVRMQIPAILLVLVMAGSKDLGPAVILAATLAVMFWRALGWRWAIVPVFVAGALGFTFAITASQTFLDRWGEVLNPRDSQSFQLASALRSMGETGLIGGGSGSGALTRSVDYGQSDYLLATIAGDFGILAAIVVFGVLAIFGLVLLQRSIFVQDARGIIATGAAVMILVPTFWGALGNFGLLPFSGVNIPLAALSGSACMCFGLLLGAAAAALGEQEDQSPPDRETGRVTQAAALVTVGAMIAMAVMGVVQMWTGGGGRFNAETLWRQRGALLAADGTVLASSGNDRSRTYRDIGIKLAAGSLVPNSDATGWEFVAGGAATCGYYRDTVGQVFPWAGTQDDCDPADVVTTIDPTVQQAVTAAVEATPGSSIMVVDRATSGILALNTHDTAAKATAIEADLAAGRTPENSTDGAADRVVQFQDDVSDADREAAKLEWYLHDGEYWDQPGPDHRVISQQEASDLAEAQKEKNVAVGTSTSFLPGSVFKLVTATAAIQAGVSPPELGAELELPPDDPLKNEWGGPCPGPGIAEMLTYSCNTAAGWIGLQVGAAGLTDAAVVLGLTDEDILAGPPDLTNGPEPIVLAYPNVNTVGLDGVANPSDSVLARSAIGQENVRTTVPGLAVLGQSIMSGERRPLTFIHGWCKNGDVTVWQSPATKIEGIDFEPIRAGMAGAVERGTATDLASVGVVAAKTGTAESVGAEGQLQNDSTLVAVTNDLIIVIRVAPTEENPLPVTGEGGAVDVAAGLLPLPRASVANPCQGH